MDDQTRKILNEVIDSRKDPVAYRESGSGSIEPVIFNHIISESELRSTYLNLADDRGRSFGENFPPHRTKLRVIDGHNRLSFASKHHKNQIWGSVKQWFLENAIKAGDVVQIKFDNSERENGYPVVHLIVLRDRSLPPTSDSERHGFISTDAATEIPITIEKQIEDFLERNTVLIEPGLSLFEAEGRRGRQYPTDVGVIDLLCRDVSGQFVVVELKRGMGSDVVVGQISRYMGWVKEHLAGSDQPVRGIILAADADEHMQYAVAANPHITAKFFKLKLELLGNPPD